MSMNKNPLSVHTAARMRGLTLIELMIVIVVVSILASLAYPSYRNQVQETRRADGLATLLQQGQALERCYTLFSSYTDANCGVAFPVSSTDNHYTVTAPTRSATAFTLAAAPQGPQAGDTECGTLMLSSNGNQGSQGNATTDANGCW